MNNSDHDIKRFFAEMKEADGQNPTPEFYTFYQKKRVIRRKFVIFSSVAASLSVFLSIFITQHKNKKIQSNIIEFEIQLLEIENTGTQSLIRNTESIYSWTPTSNSLLNNFNE